MRFDRAEPCALHSNPVSVSCDYADATPISPIDCLDRSGALLLQTLRKCILECASRRIVTLSRSAREALSGGEEKEFSTFVGKHCSETRRDFRLCVVRFDKRMLAHRAESRVLEHDRGVNDAVDR